MKTANDALNLQLVEKIDFGQMEMEVYRESGNKKDFWFTREQIGQALEYAEPRKAIQKIHERHAARLNQFSGVVNLGTPGGNQETIIYNRKGIFEICRWSEQQKADALMDWAWDVLDAVLDQMEEKLIEIEEKKAQGYIQEQQFLVWDKVYIVNERFAYGKFHYDIKGERVLKVCHDNSGRLTDYRISTNGNTYNMQNRVYPGEVGRKAFKTIEDAQNYVKEMEK